MRTPYGIECPYFYGNYFRGRSDEECRLIGNQRPPNNWTRDLCQTCPVPRIRLDNACKFMTLTPIISRKLVIGKRYVSVKAFCSKSNTVVKSPHVGCGLCHTLDDFLPPSSSPKNDSPIKS